MMDPRTDFHPTGLQTVGPTNASALCRHYRTGHRPIELSLVSVSIFHGTFKSYHIWKVRLDKQQYVEDNGFQQSFHLP